MSRKWFVIRTLKGRKRKGYSSKTKLFRLSSNILKLHKITYICLNTAKPVPQLDIFTCFHTSYGCHSSYFFLFYKILGIK